MIFFVTSLVVVSLALVVSLYFNWKLAMYILGIEESLEECLDVIDEGYRKIGQILSTPLFYDSREVRDVLLAIKRVHESLLTVANILTKGNFTEVLDEPEIESEKNVDRVK